VPRVVAENGHSTGSAAGAMATTADKTWNVLNGLGSMAFAYSFSFVLVEIQVRSDWVAWLLRTFLPWCLWRFGSAQLVHMQ